MLKKLEIVAYAEGFPTVMPQTESLPKIRKALKPFWLSY